MTSPNSNTNPKNNERKIKHQLLPEAKPVWDNKKKKVDYVP